MAAPQTPPLDRVIDDYLTYLRVERGRMVVVDQQEVVVVHHFADPLASGLRRVEVLHPQRAAADLVLIGGPDAAAGGADLRVAAPCLARLIERYVVRQDQRTGQADAQAASHIHADRFEFFDLTEQRRRR